jgi:hypothetical protein
MASFKQRALFSIIDESSCVHWLRRHILGHKRDLSVVGHHIPVGCWVTVLLAWKKSYFLSRVSTLHPQYISNNLSTSTSWIRFICRVLKLGSIFLIRLINTSVSVKHHRMRWFLWISFRVIQLLSGSICKIRRRLRIKVSWVRLTLIKIVLSLGHWNLKLQISLLLRHWYNSLTRTSDILPLMMLRNSSSRWCDIFFFRISLSDTLE